MKRRLLYWRSWPLPRAPAHAQTEIQWWHAMSGPLGEWVNDLAKDFNDSQKDYKVVPTYKGTYDESHDGRDRRLPRRQRAAHPAGVRGRHRHDDGLQGRHQAGGRGDEGSRRQVRPEGLHPGGGRLLHRAQRPDAELPVQQLDDGLPLQQGRLQGRRPRPRTRRPTTWPEVALAAAKLKASGHKCPFTTSWISWTQLESFSAWHNTLFATQNNGFGGTGARLAINSPLHVRHIENLANMAKQGLFVYKGRGNVPDASFPSGECAMFTGSSGLYARVARDAKFAYGIAPLPYYPDVTGAPQNTVIGGASLWVMAGKKPAEYKGVANFFNFLSDPDVQIGQPQAHRLPADHDGGLRADREVGLLQAEPGHRRRGDADDPQDHRQVARHPAGQLRADPHHRRRGARAGLGAARRAPRKRSMRPSSAATNSWNGSRRRTRAEALVRLRAASSPLPRPLQRGGAV